MFIFRTKTTVGSSPPSAPRPHLSVRNQTTVCPFFGVYLGVDTRHQPALSSAESLPAEVLDRFANGPVGGAHWSLLQFGAYRSTVPVSAWALVRTSLDAQGQRQDDPALPGVWMIDGNVATPENHGIMVVTPQMGAPLPISAEAEAERRDLAAALDERLHGPVAWHVMALIDLKHT